MISKKLRYILMLLLPGTLGFCQTGQEFWFAAPDASSGHNDQPIFLNISTYDVAAQVIITQPANPAFTPIGLNLPANASHREDLSAFLAMIETDVPDVVMNTGLHIMASTDVSVYYEIAPSNNTDLFSLKGENALGLEFMVSAQTYWESANKYTPTPYNSVIVVATEDNTEVTITPSNAIVGHPAGTPYTINLNRGETYMLQATGRATTDRFGGTEITSDKPIAITIADDSIENNAYGGCKDVIGDQTIPIDKLGTEYILVKGFLGGNPDRIYVMATEDNTQVNVNGGAGGNFNINRGQSHELTLNGPSVHIQADKDVYVMHVTGFGCEVGTAIVPAVYCTGSQEVSFVRSQGDDFYIVVYAPKGAETHFTINGDPNMLQPGDFNIVPGTGGAWVSARKYFNGAEIILGENYRVRNMKGNFHLGIINGGSTTGCLYGYFTDFSSVNTDKIYRF